MTTENMWTGYEASRSKQAPFPFVRTVTVDVIAAAADKLWSELMGTVSRPMKVTSVQLAFTGIEASEPGQQSIEGFFRTAPVSKRTREPDGDGQILPRSPEKVEADKQDQGKEVSHPKGFLCSRCGKYVALTDTDSAMDADVAAEVLSILRQEHDDFHLAQELAKSERSVTIRGPTVTNSGRRSVKKRRKETPQGIEKFFSRQ